MANIGEFSNVPNEVEPQGDFTPLPAGDYRVQVVKSEMRSTKKGDGQYLWLELEVLDGEYSERRLWHSINLVNPNAQTVEIAKKQFSALCHGTGVIGAQDSEQLHHRPVLAVVKVKPAQGQYAAGNDVKTYKPVDSSTTGTSAPKGASSPPSSTPPAQTKPWLRHKTAA